MTPSESSEDFDSTEEVFETIGVQIFGDNATRKQMAHFKDNLPAVTYPGDIALGVEGKINIPTYKLRRLQIYTRKVLGPTATCRVVEPVNTQKSATHQFTEVVTLNSGCTERIVTPNGFTSYFRGIDKEWDGKETHFQRIWNLLAADSMNNSDSLLDAIELDNQFKGITLTSFLAMAKQMVRRRYKVDGIGADWGTRMVAEFAKAMDPMFNSY